MEKVLRSIERLLGHSLCGFCRSLERIEKALGKIHPWLPKIALFLAQSLIAALLKKWVS